jgi:hypothetical protein
MENSIKARRSPNAWRWTRLKIRDFDRQPDIVPRRGKWTGCPDNNRASRDVSDSEQSLHLPYEGCITGAKYERAFGGAGWQLEN